MGIVRHINTASKEKAHPLNKKTGNTEIWTVGGGKGGVGKSFIASNLATLLARKENRVLLVDADLGAANLHTFLGAESSGLPITYFIKHGLKDTDGVAGKTPVPGVDLISGEKDSLNIASLGSKRFATFRAALGKADYDYVIVDLGPGTNDSTLDFFLMADKGIMVTTPQPTSIENTYRFIKCLFLTRMKQIVGSSRKSRLKELLLEILKTDGKKRSRTITGVLDRVKELDRGRGEALEDFLREVSASVIVNQAKTSEDFSIGSSMQSACRQYFGLRMDFLGNVSYDDRVEESICRRTPLVTSFEDSRAGKDLKRILETINSTNASRFERGANL